MAATAVGVLGRRPQIVRPADAVVEGVDPGELIATVGRPARAPEDRRRRCLARHHSTAVVDEVRIASPPPRPPPHAPQGPRGQKKKPPLSPHPPFPPTTLFPPPQTTLPRPTIGSFH